MGEALARWIEAERGRFILFLPVAMGAAILLYFDLPEEPPLWLGPAFGAATLGLLALVRRHPAARFGAALVLAAALGFGRAEWRTASQPPLLTVPYGAVVVAGRIAGIDILPQGRRLVLADVRLNNAPPAARTLRVRLRNDDDTALNAGDVVSLRALLFRQERPAYPGGWDFGRDAFFQGLGASGFALGDITVVQAAAPHALATWLQNLRRRIAAQILAVLPVRTGSVAVTLLTGYQQAMPPLERQAFIAAGLAHILAVAGLHVGIVMGLFFGLTRFCLAAFERTALHLNGKVLAALAALASGAAYAAITGAHLPILRSLAMASLVTLGLLVGRQAVSLRGLALAATLLMLATPEVVIGTSFQMSFSAVLALIAGYAAAQRRFRQAARPGVAGAPVRQPSGGAGVHQPVGRRRLHAVRRLPVPADPAVLGARQSGGGAADRLLGHAAGPDRAGADAIRPGLAGAAADGLGNFRHRLDDGADRHLARGDAAHRAGAESVDPAVQLRVDLAGAMAQPAAAGGQRLHGGVAAGVSHGPAAGCAGLAGRPADRHQRRQVAVPAAPAQGAELHAGAVAAGMGRLGLYRG